MPSSTRVFWGSKDSHAHLLKNAVASPKINVPKRRGLVRRFALDSSCCFILSADVQNVDNVEDFKSLLLTLKASNCP